MSTGRATQGALQWVQSTAETIAAGVDGSIPRPSSLCSSISSSSSSGSGRAVACALRKKDSAWHACVNFAALGGGEGVGVGVGVGRDAREAPTATAADGIV